MANRTRQQRSPSRRVLVADLPGGVRTLENVLGAHATIVGATTLKEALSMMEGVDLIVCGVHFDESRMYDLLRMAKAEPATRDIPFVCYRDIDSALGRPLLEGLEIACASLGAARFVDLFDLKEQLGGDRADAQFREILLSVLPEHR